MSSSAFTLREIVRFHAVIGLFGALIGFIGYGAIVAWLPAGTLPQTGTHTVAPTWNDLLHILGNNALFFLMVSVLPIVNSVIFVPQFVSIGGHAHAIAHLPASAQFDLLYRHTAFEIVALLVSIWVSYRLLFAIRAYLRDPAADRASLGRALRPLAVAYPLVLALTLVGALLEGNAVVHV